ncbi:MAG: hypothetical protein ACMUHY_00685 [Thermoplasmatota archaeon]
MYGLFGKNRESPVKEPMKLNVYHFIKGEEVVFDFNGLDFTFEKFYLLVSEDGMFLTVKDEAPMNLINLLDTVVDEVGVDRNQVMRSDEVDLVLRLDVNLFRKVKDEIRKKTDPRDVFETEYQGHKLLKVLTAYSLIEYGTVERKFKFYAEGPLADAIRKRL